VSGLITDVLRGVGAALGDLQRFVRDPAGWRDLLSELGWNAVPLPPSIAAIATPAGEVVAAIEALEAGVTPATIDRARAAVVAVVGAIDGLSGSDLGTAGLGEDLAAATFDHLVIERLARDRPVLHAALVVAGFIEVRYLHPPGRRGFHQRRLRWDNLGRLLDRPTSAWATAFAWGTGAFEAEAWTEAVADLIGVTGVDAAVELVPDHVIAQLAAAGAVPATRIGCTVRLLDTDTSTGHREIAGRIVAVTSQGLDGVAIMPLVRGSASTVIALRPGLELAVSTGAELDGGGAVVVRADGTATAVAMAGLSAGIRIALRWTFEPRPLLTIDGVRGLWAGGTELAGTITGTNAGVDLGLALGLVGGRVRASARDGDGFVAAVVPDVDTPVSATLGWSSTRGLHFHGAGGLELAVPVDRTLGPARIDSVNLALARRADGDGVGFRAGVAASVVLGPVTATIDGLGVELVVERGDPPRLLGALDVRAVPAWPTSIGLAIEGPLVSGSGSLGRSPDGTRYTGSAALRIGPIDARAAGILVTGAGTGGGYALAVMASASTSRIPIGLGFTLDRVGGFVAINRQFDAVACRTGLAGGIVSQLLAPEDVPGAEIAAIERLAPVRMGRHVLGPIARIGWGTPAMLAADIAVLIELPAPIRIILLGAIKIGLPTLAKPIVDLRLDALGVLDLARGTLAIDATLHDSTIAGYAVTGDMAVRIGWGDDPQFLVSIGGFHPAFRPPAGFPALRRLQIVVGDNPQLTVAGYLAVTSNTAQFGARADLVFTGAGFEIKGHVGFDALLEFVPFRFEVEITASASIKYRSIRLASVDLDFLLTGPRPWHAAGEATFGVLWWDVSVGFDVTWGDRAPLPLPPAPDIAAALRDALGRREAWASELAPGESAWIEVTRGDGVRVHPLGRVVARQQVVPLGHDINQFGTVPLGAPQRFAIDHVEIAGDDAPKAIVRDRFAPGQFTRLADDERLSAPAFELLDSGVRLGDGQLARGASARAPMEAVTRVVDPLAPPAKPPVRAVDAVLVLGARPTRRRPAPRGGPRVKDLGFVLASIDDLAITAEAAAIGGGARSYAGLREALRRNTAATGRPARLQVVPRIETPNRNARVVVVREDDNMRNVDFVDTVTGRAMTRAAFVDAIHAGDYPDYNVRMIRGIATPVARPNARLDDNLG
jgi:hypothetical protein